MVELPVVIAIIAILASLLFFASVLAHELGHSLGALKQGEQVRSNITLFIFSGLAQIGGEPDKPLKEFLIAVVGPLTSIALGFMSGAVWGIIRESSPSFASLFRYLGMINIALACFKLIPGFRLDGGRILRALIWGLTKNFRLATRVASFGGKVAAVLLIFWGIRLIFSGLTLNGRAPSRQRSPSPTSSARARRSASSSITSRTPRASTR